MAKYLARTCPRCGDYLGVVVPEVEDTPKTNISAVCASCGYELRWTVVEGGKTDEIAK